jgi:ankyrin repeat protein
MRFRHCLESLVCHGATHTPGCDCQELAQSYGSQLFKCNRILCPFYNQGLATSLERERHMRTHSRPYKCTELSCLFAELGLQTSRDLQLHIESHHPATINDSTSTCTTSSVTNFPIRDLVLIIKDAIKQDDLDLLQNVLPSPEIEEKHGQLLLQYAAAHGSEKAFRLILENFQTFRLDWTEVMLSAISGENIQTLQFCIERCDLTVKVLGRKPLGVAIRNGNAQVLEVFLQSGVSTAMLDYRNPSFYNGARTFGICKLHGPQLEEYMAVVQRYDMPAFLCQYIFVCAVDMNLKQLASFCLQYGAKINESCVTGFPNSFGQRKPLTIAVRRGLAEMAVFLLQNGADANADADARKKNSPGMRRIEASLGMPWTETVKLYQQCPENGGRSTPST